MAKKKKERRYYGEGSLQKEKNGKYTVRAYIDGKRVSKSTGTSDLEEAQRFADEFLRPYVKGDAQRTYDNIQALVESDKVRQERELDKLPQLTLKDAWDAYAKLPNHTDLAAATRENKRIVWSGFVKWIDEHTKGIVELRQLTHEIVDAYLLAISTECAASTYNNRVCTLREIYRALRRQARCKIDAWEFAKQREDDSHSRRELTIEELKRLALTASKHGDEWRKLFAIGIYTGLRLGDCCNLEWGRVDIVRGIIQVVPRKTKRYAHGKPVTIPISSTLCDVLNETPSSKRLGYVLPMIQKLYDGSRPEVSRRLTNIFREAGIVTSVKIEGRKHKAPEATFHSLRHTFVSMSANAGVPLHIVQSIVGHESKTMTFHYYHENITALRQAVDSIPEIAQTTNGRIPLRQPQIEQQGGIEYFPQELEGEVVDAPVADAPVRPTVRQQLEGPQKKPEWQTVTPADVAPGFAEKPAEVAAPVAEPSRPVAAVIPEGAKVEVREFGRVYVDGVATHARVGGQQARPRPPKQAWFGDVNRVWSKRHQVGLLEGMMQLVSNGGHQFLLQLYQRNTVHDPKEVCDLLEAFLRSKGEVVEG